MVLTSAFRHAASAHHVGACLHERTALHHVLHPTLLPQSSNTQLLRFNSRPVVSLAQLAAAMDAALEGGEEFLRFEVEHDVSDARLTVLLFPLSISFLQFLL